MMSMMTIRRPPCPSSWRRRVLRPQEFGACKAVLSQVETNIVDAFRRVLSSTSGFKGSSSPPPSLPWIRVAEFSVLGLALYYALTQMAMDDDDNHNDPLHVRKQLTSKQTMWHAELMRLRAERQALLSQHEHLLQHVKHRHNRHPNHNQDLYHSWNVQQALLKETDLQPNSALAQWLIQGYQKDQQRQQNATATDNALFAHHTACRRGDLQGLQALLVNRDEITMDASSSSAVDAGIPNLVRIAATYGQADVLQWLLREYTIDEKDLNFCLRMLTTTTLPDDKENNNHHRTNGGPPDHIECIQLLLDHGANATSSLTNATMPWKGSNPAIQTYLQRVRDGMQNFQDAEQRLGWRYTVHALLQELNQQIINTKQRRGTETSGASSLLTALQERRTRVQALQHQLHQLDVDHAFSRDPHSVHQLLRSREEYMKKIVQTSQTFLADHNAIWLHRSESQAMRKGDDDRGVFLNHTGHDKLATSLVSFVQRRLQLFGVETFFDSSNLKHGMQWQQEIEYNVTHCRMFVCTISPAYFSRYWCMHELDLAIQSGRQIFVVYHGCTPPKVSAALRETLRATIAKHNHGVVDPAMLERWYQNIQVIHDIQGLLNQSSSKLNQVVFCDQVVGGILEELGESYCDDDDVDADIVPQRKNR